VVRKLVLVRSCVRKLRRDLMHFRHVYCGVRPLCTYHDAVTSIQSDVVWKSMPDLCIAASSVAAGIHPLPPVSMFCVTGEAMMPWGGGVRRSNAESNAVSGMSLGIRGAMGDRMREP